MRVGGYVRLSRDEDKESYSSILSQKSIIEECAIKNQWTVYKYYEDDNCSGYTFDRPGFNAMMKDLEENRIDVVIAKDLSRIGRHNAYTLLFIDQIKKLGKRLVLPQEGGGYDSGQEESDLLGIKTWYNEMYVKDISRKIKSSIRVKQREARMLVKECYGYIKSPSDKHKLDIDLEAAETVRQIFNLYTGGLGYRKIAEALNESGCPSPSCHALYRRLGEISYLGEHKTLWTSSAVQRILKNDVYIGTLRLGKTEKTAIKGKSIIKPVGEQFVFENNHLTIISKEQFDEVQGLLNHRKKTGGKGAASKDNVFSGLLLCKDCGAYMIAYNKKGKPRSYICGSYHRFGKSACMRHSIREDTLLIIVREYLKTAVGVLKGELHNITLERSGQNSDQMRELLEYLKSELLQQKQKYKMIVMQKIAYLKKDNINQIKNIIQDSFDELENEVQSRMLYLQQRIEELENDISNKSECGGLEVSELLNQIIDKPDLGKKDIAILIDNILIDKDGNLEIFLKGDNESICKHIPEDAN